MGCNQSHTDVADDRPSTTNNRRTTTSPSTQVVHSTRSRADTTDQTGPSGRTAQWKRLLDTIPTLRDPADVESVLDSLLSRQANHLSSVQVQSVRKAIRRAVATLPPPKSKTSVVLLAGGKGQPPSTQTLVEKYHMLPPVVLRRVVPPSPIQDALIRLACTWRPQAVQWNAVVQTALAVAANADEQQHWTPNLLQACVHQPERTEGAATLLSLSALLGMGLYGSRNQQLALLFAVLADDNGNNTSAGSFALSLLEMESGIAMSKASVVHYHTHGWTSLPQDTGKGIDLDAAIEATVLVSAKNAQTVRKSRAVQLLQQAVAGHTWATPEETMNGSSNMVDGGSMIAANSVIGQQSSSHNPPLTPLQRALEHDIVRSTFVEWPDDKEERWTLVDFVAWAAAAMSDQALDAALHNVLGRGILPSPSLEREMTATKPTPSSTSNGEQQPTIFGGLGNIDQLGGLGGGVRYCIPKSWWDAWDIYTTHKSRERPPPLTTDILLDPQLSRGVGGSFEAMKPGLTRARDYVLVSPAQWNCLYELYGGGPPLPRMVSPTGKLVLYPWVLHIHVCDPVQPYRRGGETSMSMRCMSAADQPVWRLLGEILSRFPHIRLAETTGRMRLWKYVEIISTTTGKPILTRFGPWDVLCKDRYATVPPHAPSSDEKNNGDDRWSDAIDDWKAYALDSTIEDIGLQDHDSLLIEFAVVNKAGGLSWPRELAAEEGRKRAMMEEDEQFRQVLQGIDVKGNALLKPKTLVGMEVDATDRSGRWYTVRILDAQIFDEDTDDEPTEEEDEVTDEPTTRKKVKVQFPDQHFEWIDVASDRLAIAGRVASEREHRDPEAENTRNANSSSNGVSSRTRTAPSNGRSNSNAGETSNGGDNGKLCLFPGFGSCGLSNLGNTCYMNSAVQCIAYLPFLRSYLLSGQYKATGDLNKDNPLGSGGKLLEEFAELLRHLWNAKGAEHRPFKFKQLLAKTNEQFSGGDQQDAQEFLTYMIDILHEDSNKVRKKPYVESMEDEWVAKTPLPEVGEEAWRRYVPVDTEICDAYLSIPSRFLRRNRSIMADTIMGQTVNTVTCPVCRYESRSFDPFNLLSLPIPATAEVIFQCTVYRRASAENCPAALNRAKRGDNPKANRFNFGRSKNSGQPPSTSLVAEQYVVTMSRLADCGDLKLKIQNVSGISAKSIHKICRVDETVVNEGVGEKSVLKRRIKYLALSEKDGPASLQSKKRVNTDDPGIQQPIQIIAFESTLNIRNMDSVTDSGQEQDPPTDSKQKFIHRMERYLSVYGDESECRIFDSDPVGLAQAVSRSLWPTNEDGFRVGLRVDAKDKEGSWYTGSITKLYETDDMDEDQHLLHVHFDNYLARWDEDYTMKQIEQNCIYPLYTKTKPRSRQTEFTVYHRFQHAKGHVVFGLSFFIQCKNDWSHARAGAHLLAQASRFLQSNSGRDSSRLAEDVLTNLSDFIDFLVECDREYIRMALGMSTLNSTEERSQPCFNPGFDGSQYMEDFDKKVTKFLKMLPFTITVSQGVDSAEKARPDDIPLPFSLNAAIGNFVGSTKGAGHSLILQWKDSSEGRKSDSAISSSSRKHDVLYATPKTHVHETGAEVLKAFKVKQKEENGSKATPDAELNLGDCLQEYCKEQKLPLSDMWKCPKCKAHREGRQSLAVWRLPDLLTFHIKRFNMSARWHERIGTKVDFPMTGLNVKKWCHGDSPSDDCLYDLIAVINHYGSMTGGHYVATCKATASGKEGQEDVAYSFNGVGVNATMGNYGDIPSGWLRGKPKSNQSRVDSASKAVSDSAEPLWLQFDDEVVEPISPQQVVSEMAYVLFYRRRNLTPSNVAKYCTLG